MFQHLLVAIDRRAGSHRAAMLGLRVAWCLDARVTVLFVVAAPRQAMSPSAAPRSHDALEVGERVFRRIRRIAMKTGVPCVCRYAFGRDAQVIVSEAAHAHQCDLIVLSAPETAELVIEGGC